MIRSSPPDVTNPSGEAEAFPHGLGCATLPALLSARAAASPSAVAQWRLAPDSTWQPLAWAQYHESAARIAAGVRTLGLVAGERVGIMARSSHRWDWASMGILGARGVVVGIDAHDLDEHVSDIARRAGLVGLVLQDSTLLAKFDAGVLQGLRFVILLDPPADRAGPPAVTRWTLFDSLIEAGGSKAVDAAWDQSRPTDAATLIFTSGTTGTPKGILYRHEQACTAVDAILQAFDDIDMGSRLACWLPLSNLFQRMINWCAIGRGAQTYYVEDPREVMRHVPGIAPHVFIGVPRFYEKLHQGMMERVEQAPAPVKMLAHWAFRAGDVHARRERARKPFSAVPSLMYALADRLVLRRFRQALGGELRYLVSGSAPMPVWLLERLHAMGLLVLEAYGMSENVVPVAINRPGAYRFGTVGQALGANQVRLAEDGELLVRGPGVFEGYFGEEPHPELFDAEGFLFSGDFARIDAEGFIALTGRKSEIFKTSTGRRVAPATVEEYLRRVPGVEHAAVFGAGRERLVAVLSLAQEAFAPEDGAGLAAAERRENLRGKLMQALAPLPGHLRPAGVVLTRRPFAIQTGELTANLKLRRGAVLARYGACLEELYNALGTGTSPFAGECEPGAVEILSL